MQTDNRNFIDDMNMKKTFALLCLCFWFVNIVAQTKVDAIREQLFSCNENSVLVVAHRGDWRNFPENSLEGIESAIQMGVDVVELDVQRTGDGVFILMHDGSLDRTTTGRGKIAEVDWEYVSKLRLRNGCGIATDQKVPTLEQALLLCKDKVMVNLDKADRYFDEIFPLLEKTGTTNLVIMKGGMPSTQVKEKFGEYLNKVIYMPIVNISKADGEEVIASHLQILEPLAFELCFSTDNSPALEKMKDTLKGRSLIWINTLWASLCGGHHDDVSLKDIDNGYGYVIDKLGARIIQTDRPQFLLDYLRSRNLHK